jgi:hypothetical protein
MNEVDGELKIYVTTRYLHFWIESVREDYTPFFEPVVQKAGTTFWLVDNVLESVERWGGSYDSFKAQHVERLQVVRANWDFFQEKVCLSLFIEKRSFRFISS